MRYYQKSFFELGRFDFYKALVLLYVYKTCTSETRYELHFDYNPRGDYGATKAVIACWGPEMEQSSAWEIVEYPGYGKLQPQGAYLLARGVVGTLNLKAILGALSPEAGPCLTPPA